MVVIILFFRLFKPSRVRFVCFFFWRLTGLRRRHVQYARGIVLLFRTELRAAKQTETGLASGTIIVI